MDVTRLANLSRRLSDYSEYQTVLARLAARQDNGQANLRIKLPEDRMIELHDMKTLVPVLSQLVADKIKELKGEITYIVNER